MNRASTTKDKKDSIKTGRRGKDTVTPKKQKLKSRPRHGNPQLGGIPKIQNFILKSEGFMLHTKYFNPSTLHQRNSPPKCQALKNTGDHVQENHRTVGNRETSLKGFMQRLSHPKTQHKTSIWKAPIPYVKKTHILTLNHLPKRQRTSRTSSRDRHWWPPYLQPHSVLLMSAMEGNILKLSF